MDIRKPGTANAFTRVICHGCGHIMYVDTVACTVRDLTPTEKRLLPSHPFAKEIRAAQERVVRWMIG